LIVITLLVFGSTTPRAVQKATEQGFALDAASLPSFEVASIKLNKHGEARTSSLMAPGGRYLAENMSVQRLVREAYQLQEFQITGGPSWVTRIIMMYQQRRSVNLVLRRSG